jgi:hypothetical protein
LRVRGWNDHKRTLSGSRCIGHECTGANWTPMKQYCEIIDTNEKYNRANNRVMNVSHCRFLILHWVY